jgi:nicotinamide mononucleotide transporter
MTIPFFVDLELPVILEAVGVLANLAAVAYSVRRNILTWPVGLVGAVTAGWLFSLNRLYADAALQVLFFAQGVYGWWAWRRPVRELPIRRLTSREWTQLIGVVGGGTLALGAGLDHWTNSDVPYSDAFLSVVSVVANGLLTRKIIDNWPLWVLVDVLYVGLFAYKGLWGYAGLYLLFVGMAAYAWAEWRRAHAAEAALTPPPAL